NQNVACWTRWSSRDTANKEGDFETLKQLRNEYPGQICPNPIYIEAVTAKIMIPAEKTGFVCCNADQKWGPCKSYKSFFSEGWTEWFDRDTPSITGDKETLSSLRRENPGKICPNPTNIEAVTLSGHSVEETGEKIFKYDTKSGFVCRNRDQRDWKCQDYKVRFSCSFCLGVCWFSFAYEMNAC
uniref:WxxW domain-containing protein n=1 Tax=Poecilia reticulata TaxID=8081 RepID=A0A3P9NI39_POERE